MIDPAVCKEPVDSGSCTSGLKRFYFDDELQTCRGFIYTGCGGNRNRFKTFESCIHSCLGSKSRKRDPQISIISYPFQLPASNVVHIFAHTHLRIAFSSFYIILYLRFTPSRHILQFCKQCPLKIKIKFNPYTNASKFCQKQTCTLLTLPFIFFTVSVFSIDFFYIFYFMPQKRFYVSIYFNREIITQPLTRSTWTPERTQRILARKLAKSATLFTVLMARRPSWTTRTANVVAAWILAGPKFVLTAPNAPSLWLPPRTVLSTKESADRVIIKFH